MVDKMYQKELELNKANLLIYEIYFWILIYENLMILSLQESLWNPNVMMI